MRPPSIFTSTTGRPDSYLHDLDWLFHELRARPSCAKGGTMNIGCGLVSAVLSIFGDSRKNLPSIPPLFVHIMCGMTYFARNSVRSGRRVMRLSSWESLPPLGVSC